MKTYILGNIRKIIFESDTGPYKVGLFKVKETNSDDLVEYVNKIIGFTGSFNEINEDLDYIFYGNMVNHPKYGLQFNVSNYEIKKPSDKDGLILYLSSSLFKGIGVKTAEKIVSKFGENTIDIIKDDYEQLANIPGITIGKARQIYDVIINNDMNQDLILKLNSYGFSVKEAIDLIAEYGYDLMNIIENNIYELYPEINFNKLDMIFLSSHEDNESLRIEALIKYNIYNMCYESGDTLIQKEELFIKMKKCFKENFDSNTYLKYINNLLNQGDLIEINGFIALYDFYITEKDILTNINRINDIKSVVKEENISKKINNYEKKYKITFDIEQKEAIKEAIINNFYIITGGPGTGKTTIIKAIVELIQDINKISDKDIVLLAPTGRSAKRMQESVGINAYTIHKFLKWNKETNAFQIDEYNKAKEKVVIVDESSMIDIFLFNSLLKGLRLNVKLILIGDPNQLPSIGPGDVLNDLLNLDYIKSKCLKTIYRVKNGSYISDLAVDIKNQREFDKIENYDDFKFIESNDMNIKNYLTQICNKIRERNIKIDNFQVLVPMYKGINGIDNLNILMSNIFNSKNKKYQINDKFYRINDKVIQLVNDVDNNVYNGDIGYIKNINIIDNKYIVQIDFNGNIVTYLNGDFDKFTLAYAISIHKSQGSEYDNVVIVLAKSFTRMFYNKLIYTAVTRAKSSLIIIGELESFNKSIQTLYANNRNTYLKCV